MPDFTAAITLLKKPFEDLYALAGDALREKLAMLKAQAKIKTLHKRLWESQRVKTIWHTDKPLSLASFFYPVSVHELAASREKRVKVNGLENLPAHHTVIYGTVGQGKSILLRFLLGRELKSGQHVPLLCELRNVESQTLLSHLNVKFAELLKIEPDEKLFSFFAENGKIAFLLDGFDEVAPDYVQRMLQELSDLANKFSKCRIVLTSRPDSECRHLTTFHIAKIAELAADDYEPFYRKIGHDIDFAKRLVVAIQRSPTEIQKLVVTPLLATLLAISYRAAQKIPLEFSDFYEDLFQTLLIRHDASKYGWKRSRQTKLNDQDFQQAFEAFCFATRKRRSTALSPSDAMQIAKACLADIKLDADSQHFLDDVRRVTCLLVEDGGRLQFVHNSVQEFFAARYVRTRTEAVADSFYRQLLKNLKWMYWQEELLFLKQIDAHRAKKYFFAPDLQMTLDFLFANGSKNLSEAAAGYLEEMAVEKNITKINGMDSSRYVIRRIRRNHTYQLQVLDSRIFAKLFINTPWNKGFQADLSCMQRTYLQIAVDQGEEYFTSLIEFTKSVISAQKNELEKSNKQIEDAEKITGLIDLSGI